MSEYILLSTRSNRLGVSVEQGFVSLLFLRFRVFGFGVGVVIVRFLLHVHVSGAEEGRVPHFLFLVVVSTAGGGSGRGVVVGFRTFLCALGGGCVGVFGLVGSALALWGCGGGGLGVVVVVIAVGVAVFGTGEFRFDGGFGALLWRGFGRGGIVSIVVAVRVGFVLGFLGGWGRAGGVDGGTVLELLLDDAPGSVGGFAVGEAGELGEFFVVDLGGVVSLAGFGLACM